jgi:carbonic anhydrase/acetyltransferase-like protein (isoleucine patch superfamily)
MHSPDQKVRPKIGNGVYIAPTAYVGGRVKIGDGSTIMHHATIRGDVSSITIGKRVNIQDGVVIHTHTGVPLEIADEVVIGHRAVVHCRRVALRALIGIGAIVLDDCEIGAGAIIAAGAVLPPGTKIPPGKLAVGVPGRIARDVTDDERAYIDFAIDNYCNLNRAHAAGRFPNWNDPA